MIHSNDFAKEIGYEGCRNCANQIEPLRMCWWAEHGGDGKIHTICPYWKNKADQDEKH